MSTLKNFIIIGHESLSREGLVQAVSCASQVGSILAVASFEQADVVLKEYKPDALIIMLDHEDTGRLGVIHHAKVCNPDINIMVISSCEGGQGVLNTIQTGVAGYLNLDDALDNIEDHLLTMFRGDFPISPSIAKYVLRREEPENIRGNSVLSPREVDVLQIMAMGHSRAMIAESLNISPHTVTTHIKHIYKKLGAHSRTEAIFISRNMELLTVSEEGGLGLLNKKQCSSHSMNIKVSR